MSKLNKVLSGGLLVSMLLGGIGSVNCSACGFRDKKESQETPVVTEIADYMIISEPDGVRPQEEGAAPKVSETEEDQPIEKTADRSVSNIGKVFDEKETNKQETNNQKVESSPETPKKNSMLSGLKKGLVTAGIAAVAVGYSIYNSKNMLQTGNLVGNAVLADGLQSTARLAGSFGSAVVSGAKFTKNALAFSWKYKKPIIAGVGVICTAKTVLNGSRKVLNGSRKVIRTCRKAKENVSHPINSLKAFYNAPDKKKKQSLNFTVSV